MGHKRITLIIDSQMRNTPLIGMAVNRLCRAASFSDMEAFNIELCAVEAVTNSIRHCYRGEPGHEVKVVLTVTQDEVVLDIWDIGPPIEACKLEKACLPYPADGDDICSIPEGGRGLGIIRGIMDSVAYRSGRDGNCLTLRKKLPSKKAP